MRELDDLLKELSIKDMEQILSNICSINTWILNNQDEKIEIISNVFNPSR